MMILEVVRGPLTISFDDDPPITWETGDRVELPTCGAIHSLFHFGEAVRVCVPCPLVAGSMIKFRNPNAQERIEGPCEVAQVNQHSTGPLAILLDIIVETKHGTRRAEVGYVPKADIAEIDNTAKILSIVRECLSSWNGILQDPELFTPTIARLHAAGVLSEEPHA